MNRFAIAAVAAFLLYIAMRGEGAVTAGDEESNIIFDGIDEAMSYVSEWPNGSGPYEGTISAAADKYGVPTAILAWLLWKESRYSMAIITGAKRSRVGAMGIAQFMPATAREELGSEAAALDPDQAIPGAARYLAKLYRSAGTWAGALAAYNWGIGNVTRKGLASAPPETLDYYTTILAKAGGQYA
ncbi:transglycosylase SLT domain-containing protein [Pseudoduganella sp. UC29_71]|uniref:transglycosylase SLT domain-containing protein n=1 Tax=Pseudoduganella sp. UC29_71 TaxID=3350174 RepID=UPI00366B6340